MSIQTHKIGAWLHPISAEADKPVRTATEMKAIFDSNSNELKTAHNALIDDLEVGAQEIAFSDASTRANIASGDSHATILGKVKKWLSDLKQLAFSASYQDITDFPIPRTGTAGQVLKLNTTPAGDDALDLAWVDQSGGGGGTQVQSDWTDADATSAAFIKNKPDGVEISLLASGWVVSGDGYTQAVSVNGMTADSNVIVCPAPSSRAVYNEIDVYCSLQGSGSLTFTAGWIPEAALTVNVLILT